MLSHRTVGVQHHFLIHLSEPLTAVADVPYQLFDQYIILSHTPISGHTAKFDINLCLGIVGGRAEGGGGECDAGLGGGVGR